MNVIFVQSLLERMLLFQHSGQVVWSFAIFDSQVIVYNGINFNPWDKKYYSRILSIIVTFCLLCMVASCEKTF